MTNRLRAWLHWTDQGEHADEDAKMMARDIKLLFEVVEAARRVCSINLNTPEAAHLQDVRFALAKLEGEG